MEFATWPINKIRKAANNSRVSKISLDSKANLAANKTNKPRAATIKSVSVNRARSKTTSSAAKSPI